MSAKNLVELCEQSCTRFPDRTLFGQKRADTWIWTTYAQFHRVVDRCRAGLSRAYGIGEGDRVVVLADNRIEWAVAAHACYGLGAVFVPLHRTHDRHEWETVLAESGARLAFAPDLAHMSALSEMRARLSLSMHIVGFDLGPHDDRGWTKLLSAGDAAKLAPISPDADRTAELLFEGGALRPRTHRELLEATEEAVRAYALVPDDRALSLLPWADPFAQIVEMHALFAVGGSVAIDTDPGHQLDELAEVHPTLFLAEPALFRRVHERIGHAIDEQVGPLRSLIRAGLKGAIKRSHGEHVGTLEALEAGFDERVVFKKIREQFGGRLRMVVTTDASVDREISDLYDALGIAWRTRADEARTP